MWFDVGMLLFEFEMKVVILDIIFVIIFGWEFDCDGDEWIWLVVDGFNGCFVFVLWVLLLWVLMLS